MKDTQLEDLVKAYQQTKDEKVLEKILKQFDSNLKEIVTKQYKLIEHKLPYYSEEDLYITAQMELIKAIKNYNPNSTNNKYFTSFANLYVFREVSKECSSINKDGQHIPYMGHGHSPAIEELNLSDFLTEIEEKEMSQKLLKLFNQLPAKEKKFYSLYHNINNSLIGDGLSLSELGIMFGINHNSARNLAIRIEKYLYKYLDYPKYKINSFLFQHSRKSRAFMNNAQKLGHGKALFCYTFESPADKEKALNTLKQKDKMEQSLISSYYGLNGERLNVGELSTKYNKPHDTIRNILKNFTCEVLNMPIRTNKK